jgi:hypothetical protein
MDYGRIDINSNHLTMLYSQQFEKVNYTVPNSHCAQICARSYYHLKQKLKDY